MRHAAETVIPSPAFGTFVGKQARTAGAIALLLHVVDVSQTFDLNYSPIPATTFIKAQRIVESFLLPHAELFYGSTAVDGFDKVLSVAGAIIKAADDGVHGITARELRKAVKGDPRTAERHQQDPLGADAIHLQRLADAGQPAAHQQHLDRASGAGRKIQGRGRPTGQDPPGNATADAWRGGGMTIQLLQEAQRKMHFVRLNLSPLSPRVRETKTQNSSSFYSRTRFHPSLSHAREVTLVTAAKQIPAPDGRPPAT